ncbi:MAG: hypothetical protein Q4G68_10150 [Planctomycetia bacterium]|nr:hypothetical protein [Planctomycetia bacterium]
MKKQINIFKVSTKLVFFPAFLLCVLTHLAAAEEYIPVAGYTQTDIQGGNHGDYVLEKMFDGRLDTLACLRDDTRDGDQDKGDPAGGSVPVTASFVLDLGDVKKTEGIRFVSRNIWETRGVKNVSVFACDDKKGQENVRPLVENEEILPTNYSYSACLLWPTVESRYYLVQVNDAYGTYSNCRDWPLPRRSSGPFPRSHYNVQIAEVRLLATADSATGSVRRNEDGVAYPQWRLEQDWMYQDCGTDFSKYFISDESSEQETRLIDKVVAELEGETATTLREEQAALLSANRPGCDAAWKELYFKACRARREARLAFLLEETNQIIYVKHCVFGGGAGLTGMPQVTDEQFLDTPPEIRGGSQLCMISFDNNGNCRHEVLIDKPKGIIRDINLSFDASSILFSMRDSFDDDYHLYTMNLTDRSVRQITFTPEAQGRKFGCADIEPCYTPDGHILFASTRHVQINDCWPNANTNIFTCDSDGKNIRRLGYDELDVNFPQILNDGRVLFTRWEYSDRNAFFLHPLMTMNPDGTMQTEFCGNNSMYPASYIQAKAIPDSTKILAIISGHHTCHKGKLALVDRSLGTQNGDNIEHVAGASPDGTPGRKKSTITTTGFHDNSIDYFGQDGAQYRNPCPLDEENYLVSYCPEGYPNGYDGPFLPPLGLYFMTADGQRELLAFDWYISTGSSVAVREREIPPVKPRQANPNENFGTFIVQDVYVGPGLKDIPRGVVKKLRVVGIEYRCGWMGKGSNAGEVVQGLVQTPISFNNGSWDVKHVLGEVNVELDGSCKFEVPARTPVYFQLLDENGYCVQTMRSWATLQGGETFACLGCHEDKLDVGQMQERHLTSIAASKPAQKLLPFAGKNHPLMLRLQKESCLDSIENYWGINAPPADTNPNATVDGFSYTQEIQPILDQHCVECHAGQVVSTDNGKTSSLALTGEYVPVEAMKTSADDDHKRSFTQSYLALTNNGFAANNPYIQWIEVRSRSEILPPYHTGSAKSPLMKYLEPEHYGVQVSDSEKRTVACWIDLLVPFCGSYTQANRWTEAEKQDYLNCIEKRRFFAEQERQEVLKSRKP